MRPSDSVLAGPTLSQGQVDCLGDHVAVEGLGDDAQVAAARAVVEKLRGAGVDGVVLGCTEIHLLLPGEDDAPDLINPLALLAEAAVRFAIA